MKERPGLKGTILPKITSKHRVGGLGREERQAWLFAAPGLSLLVLFVVVPFVMAFVLAFTDQKLVPNRNIPTEFIGLKNFIDLFQDETFWHALRNNLIFTGVVVPVQTAFALCLAVLVNTRRVASPKEVGVLNLFRTIFFSPVATTMVVVSVVWVFLYEGTPEGTINRLIGLMSLGLIGPQHWLADTQLALGAIMLVCIWQGVGFQMVAYLAGLQAIPDDLYEAASIDGATAIQQFFYVTIPLLRNTTVAVVIITTILAFKVFAPVQVMTIGGPLDATQTMIYYTKVMGFDQGKIGYASALTIVFFIIVLMVSLIQRFVLKSERAVESMGYE
jgi:multiple sugar transport system permease protein